MVLLGRAQTFDLFERFAQALLLLARRPLPRGLPPLGRLLIGLLAFQLRDVLPRQLEMLANRSGFGEALLAGVGADLGAVDRDALERD